MHILIVLFLLMFSTLSAFSQTPSTSDVSARREKLQKLFDDEWQYELRTSPETATAYGDKRYNDRLSDLSPAALQADLEQQRKFLLQFQVINPAGLPEQDALSYKLMVRNLRQDLEESQLRPWETPISQFGGPHTYIIDLVTLTPFKDVKDYENYISRLHQIPRLFDQLTANMRQGITDGLMPPRYLLEKAAAQTEAIAKVSADASPFRKPVEKFPESISAADQERLRTAVISAIQNDVIPAYRKLADFMTKEYAPKGRTEPGVWALPDGDARYRFAVKNRRPSRT